MSPYRKYKNGYWRSVVVQVISEPGICHVAGFEMRAEAGVRVVIYKSHVIESRMFKNRDKQMTYIVRVMLRHCLLVLTQMFLMRQILNTLSDFSYKRLCVIQIRLFNVEIGKRSGDSQK